MFVSLLWNRYWAGHIRIVGIVVGGFDYLIWSVWSMVLTMMDVHGAMSLDRVDDAVWD